MAGGGECCPRGQNDTSESEGGRPPQGPPAPAPDPCSGLAQAGEWLPKVTVRSEQRWDPGWPALLGACPPYPPTLVSAGTFEGWG